MLTFKRRELPWASGIGKNVNHCTTSQEVMKAAHLDFIVDKCDLVARMPFNINNPTEVNDTMGDFAYGGHVFRDCPNAFATYRTDKNIPLGLVKSKYEVIQNTEAFKFFDDAIGKDKAIWQYAGQYGYGEKIFVTAKLPIETTVDGDPIDNYLVFNNSHDGSSSINIMFTPVRVACTNMLNGALQSASSYIRIRHTRTAHEKLQTGAEILRIACDYALTAQELYNTLTKINVPDANAAEYFAKLVLSDEEFNSLMNYDKDKGIEKLIQRNYLTMEATNISTRKANRIANLNEYYYNGIAQEPIVGNAWGLYNAVTGYYSNVENLQGIKRFDSLLYGNANNVMSKALNAAYELAVA